MNVDDLYDRLLDEEDARVCKDIPDAACSDVPRNFFLIIFAQFLTKLGDALANAKTVLPWLMNSLGAPGAMLALLVPIRESGSMLPQILIGGWVRVYPRRKFFFVVGCVLQGLAILSMPLIAMSFEGALAGSFVIASLVVFSLARGLCSVASKDVIGKTVPKTRRGRLTGFSSSAAGLLTLLIAVLMMLDLVIDPSNYQALLILAGLAWLIAALVYAGVSEQAGETGGGGNAFKQAISSLNLLRSDHAFRNFVAARALMMSSGLAAPFIVSQSLDVMDDGLISLALFVALSGGASLISGSVWGKLSDENSLRVMQVGALLCCLICAAAFAASAFNLPYQGWILLILFFLLMLTHEGVRVGRKTYVVDLASGNRRTDYVAVSNTAIGLLLLLAGAMSSALASWSISAVLLVFSFASGLAFVLTISSMKSIQH